MGAFGGLILTNKGRALQAKAQTGVQLHYTRIAVGDGNLSGQSILDLNALISQKKTMNIGKLRTLTDGKAVVGSVLSNQDLSVGFYFRELGVFAQDPDLGEVLYCYGNAGANAEYIPAAGGSDIIEKYIDAVVIIGNASNVTAVIDESLIFLTQQEYNTHRSANVLDHPDGSVTDAKIGSRTIDDTVSAADGADTPTRLWSKLGNMIKRITGEDKWYTAPARTIKQLYADLTTAQGTANSALSRANASLPKDGSEAMTGPLKISPQSGTPNSWSQPLYFQVIDAGGTVRTTNHYIQVDPDGNIRFRGPSGVMSYIWNSENDGAGSGLDADLLRGVALGRILKGMGDQPHNLSPNKQIVYRVIGDGTGMLYPGPYGIGISLSSDAGSGSYTLHFYHLNGTLYIQQTDNDNPITLAGWVKVWTSANINPVSKNGDTIKFLDIAKDDGDAILTVEDKSAPNTAFRVKRIYSSKNVNGGNDWLFRQLRPSDGAIEDFYLQSGKSGDIWTTGMLRWNEAGEYLEINVGGVMRPLSGIKPIQHGTVAAGAGQTDIIINSVDTSKAYPVISSYGAYAPPTGDSGASNTMVYAEIINATTLRVLNDSPAPMKWHIIEHR